MVGAAMLLHPVAPQWIPRRAASKHLELGGGAKSAQRQTLSWRPARYLAPGLDGTKNGSLLCPCPSMPDDKLDVIALSNLCVDVFVPVDTLPSSDTAERSALLGKLSCQPPDRSAWEIGGNGNFMIAAARIGMNVSSIGHIGKDVYGQFLQEVLQEEGVNPNQHLAPENHPLMDHTLVCFVLVDPGHQHAFCSRYDFGPWPLLEGVNELPEPCMKLLTKTKAIFTNGFVFDELPVSVLLSSCQAAIASGAHLFFDPGPRCFTMKEGPRKEALQALLDLSTVVLMTEDEARVVTGCEDPEAAASYVLSRPNSRVEWCVVKLGGEGALLRSKFEGKTYRSKGFKVEVEDTVGCGDSFASAIVLGYTNKFSIPSTLALANAVGASTASRRGAGRNVATSEMVLSMLHAAMANKEEHEDHKERAVHAAGAIDILRMSMSDDE